jgi:hypothetical protein
MPRLWSLGPRQFDDHQQHILKRPRPPHTAWGQPSPRQARSTAYEAGRIAANVAKLPDLLRRSPSMSKA